MAKSKAATAVAVAIAVLAGATGYGLRAKHATPGDVTIQFGALPLEFGGYAGQEQWFDEATYTVLKADTSTWRGYYDQNGKPIWLFAAYFGEQNYGEQIHSPRNCLPGGGWNILTLDRLPVTVEGRGNISVNRLLIEADGRRQVVYYFFVTRVGDVASEYELKLRLAQAALTFKPRDAVFIRVMAPVGPEGVERADQRSLAFLNASLPLLMRGLPF